MILFPNYLLQDARKNVTSFVTVFLDADLTLFAAVYTHNNKYTWTEF